MAAASLLDLTGCVWLSDSCEEYDEPDYSEEGRCARCGRGATVLRRPLRLSPKRVPARANIARIPPALVIVSASVAMWLRKKRWSGVRLRQVVNRGTGEPSERHFVLEITSILPPKQKRA